MDKLWVKDIQTGQRAAGVFQVARKQQAAGKNGKPFLKVVLQDKTGLLDARIWNQADELSALFEPGDRVQVEGPVGSFQGRPQLTIEALEKSPEDLDPADFAYEAPPEVREPKAAGGEASLGALRSELSKVTDPHVKALLFSFLDDPEVASRLRRAPAAKEIHHAYPGGLLDHVLSCVRLASRLADHYPMADHDLLLAGAFLHDLGKISELSYDKGITTYTDEGKLVGHLVMTATWIRERAAAIPGFPKDLENHLIHIVLAHHGRLEYGSPKLPMTIEAFLVHELDEIDSRMDAMLGQMARSPGKKWTDPQKTHERMMWKGPAPTEAGRRKGPPGKAAGKARGERREKRDVPAGEAVPAEAVAGEARRRERKPRERAVVELARVPAPAAEGPSAPVPTVREGEERRRGPKILKRAPGAPAAGGEKLTFKPFSAFTGEGEGGGERHEPAEESGGERELTISANEPSAADLPAKIDTSAEAESGMSVEVPVVHATPTPGGPSGEGEPSEGESKA